MDKTLRQIDVLTCRVKPTTSNKIRMQGKMVFPSKRKRIKKNMYYVLKKWK